jgi:hypothetical protein
MPQQIDVPGVGVVEFPDGMTDTQIVEAIQANTKQQAVQPPAQAEPQSRMEQIESVSPYTLNVAGYDTGVKIPKWAGRGLAGAGKAMVDLGRGAGQLVGLTSQQDEAAAREADAPLMGTTSGKVGYFGGGAATALPASLIPGVNTYTGAALTGAGIGMLSPTVEGESRAFNAAAGAAGGVAGKGIGDLVSGMFRTAPASLVGSAQRASVSGGKAASKASVSGEAVLSGKGGGYTMGTAGPDPSAGLNSTRAALAKRARAAGYELTPGQASGSKVLQQLEAKLESQPMTSGPFYAVKDNNQKLVNRAVAGAIGESADVVDSGVLAAAHERLSSNFKHVSSDVKKPVDVDSVMGKLASIEDDFEGLVSTSDNPLVKRFVSYLEKGEASGRQLAGLSSKLGRAANQQMTGGSGDREAGIMLYQVKDTVDDLIASGLPEKQAKAFDEARKQYRNFITVAKSQGVVNPASGDVSGKTLGNVLNRKDFHGYTLGKNESPMYEAARFSKSFGPIVGDSGTATRMPLPGATDYLVSLPLHLATKAYLSSPSVSLAQGLGKVADSRVMQGVGGLINPILQRVAAPAGAYGLLGITK